MEVKAIAKYQRVSAQKARLVADLVRGKNVEDALNLLRFTQKKSAGLIYKVVHSAMSNAMNNSSGMDVDSMYVKEVLVNEGPTWKRFMPRSQGRANSILKRTSHITVVLSEARNGQE